MNPNHSWIRRPVIVAGLVVLGSASVRAQLRMVPDAQVRDLSAAETSAYHQQIEARRTELEALQKQIEERRRAGQDTEQLSRQYEQKNDELENLRWGEMRGMAVPIAEHYARVCTELRASQRRENAPLTPAEASGLIEQLYHDWGVRPANARHQVSFLMKIDSLMLEPDITDEVRDTLREGLLGYYRNGGGYSSISIMQELASGLAVASGPEDLDALGIAYALREEYLVRRDELQLGERSTDESMERAFAPHDAFTKTLGALESVTAGEGEDEPSNRRARKAIDRMVRLMRSAHQNPGRVDSLRELATSDFRSGLVNDAMLSLLLVFYHQILNQTAAGGVSDDVAHVIDKHLLELGERSRGPVAPGAAETETAAGNGRSEPRQPRAAREELRTADHWKLWGRAAGALRKHASAGMREMLATRGERESDATIKEALSDARDALQKQGEAAGKD